MRACVRTRTYTQSELFLYGGGQHNARDNAGARKLGCDLATVTEGWVFPDTLHPQKRRTESHCLPGLLWTLSALQHPGLFVLSLPPPILLFMCAMFVCAFLCARVRHTCRDQHNLKCCPHPPPCLRWSYSLLFTSGYLAQDLQGILLFLPPKSLRVSPLSHFISPAFHCVLAAHLPWSPAQTLPLLWGPRQSICSFSPILPQHSTYISVCVFPSTSH